MTGALVLSGLAALYVVVIAIDALVDAWTHRAIEREIIMTRKYFEQRRSTKHEQ